MGGNYIWLLAITFAAYKLIWHEEKNLKEVMGEEGIGSVWNKKRGLETREEDSNNSEFLEWKTNWVSAKAETNARTFV